MPQVAALEAEREALYAENQGLNKQQAALSSEVGMGGGGDGGGRMQRYASRPAVEMQQHVHRLPARQGRNPAPSLPLLLLLLLQVRQLKQGANALTDEASQLRYKLSQAKGQTELLRGQIVQSPQKIQVGEGRGR